MTHQTQGATSMNERAPTSRRAVLAGIAAAPALAVSAFALTSVGTPDPIFAAIENHRKLEADWLSLCRSKDELGEGDQEDTPELVAAGDAAVNARLLLANTVPTTPAGLAAYLDYLLNCSVVELETFFFDDDDEIMPFLKSLHSAVHGMSGLRPMLTPPPAAPAIALSGSDPILALIEQHRAADAHWDTLHEEDDEAVYNAAANAASDIASILGQTQPTTLAGILAIVRYRREHAAAFPGYHLFVPEGLEGENTDPQCLLTNWLATIEQSIAAIACEAVS
jgi:hypothetical protein